MCPMAADLRAACTRGAGRGTEEAAEEETQGGSRRREADGSKRNREGHRDAIGDFLNIIIRIKRRITKF